MGNPVGTGQYELSADRTQLQKDLAAAKQDVATSGAAAEKTFGQAFSSSTAIKAGLLGIGTTAAAGFGLATKGALEAQSAQGAYMAQTGATREQAKLFVSDMDGIAGSAGTVGKSFTEITDVGTQVANQFGTTGKATADLTDQFFSFAKASGQDAKSAVLGLNDTMTAFGEPTQNATQDMDLLIASHQKFGTDVGPATIQTLQNIAPAMQSLGGDFSDGVGLMNAFESAGINANGAMKDLTSVVKNFPPGTTLDSVITKLGQAKDPADLLNQSIAIFGDKMGPAMAKVIQPGMTSLDNFKVSVDDAKGATQTAAQNMETDSDKIRGAMDKLTAGAREVGQDFGPALTGLASLGSLAGPLIAGGKDLLEKVGPKLLGTAAVQGALVGEAEGGAESAAASATSVVQGWLAKFGLMTSEKVVAATAAGVAEGEAEGEASATAATGPGILAKFKGGGGALGAATGVAFGAAAAIAIDQWMQGEEKHFQELRGQIDTALGDDPIAAQKVQANLGPWRGFIDLTTQAMQNVPVLGDGMRRLGGDLTGLVGDVDTAAAGMGTLNQSFRDGERDALPAFVNSATTSAQAWRDSFTSVATKGASDAAVLVADVFDHDSRPPLVAGSTAAAHAAADALANKQIWTASAQAITGDLAGTLEKGASSDIKTAMDKVTYAMDHPLQLEHQKSEIEAALSSKKLATALASSNPEISTTAHQQQQYLIGLWQNLTGQAWTQGGQTSTNLDNSLSSKYPDIRSGARNLVGDVNQIFDALKTNYNVSVAYHAGQIAKNDLPRFAEGGYAPADKYFLAGEQGPEILKFDTGASVMPAGATREWRSAFNSSAAPTQGEVHYHTHTHFQIAGNVIGDRAGLAALGQAIDDARGLSQRTRPPLGGAFGN